LQPSSEFSRGATTPPDDGQLRLRKQQQRRNPLALHAEPLGDFGIGKSLVTQPKGRGVHLRQLINCVVFAVHAATLPQRRPDR
jgi:hypothetical protein